MNTPTKLLLTVLLFIALNNVHGQQNDQNGFTLVKEDGNIAIYERWTIFPKSDPPVKAREVKGIFLVNASISEAIKLIQDEKKIEDWQKHVSEFKVYLKSYDTSWWEEYSYHDIPWPVSDQDHFLIYEIVESTPNRAFITFETTKNDKVAPVREDVDRMTLSGSWLFEEVKPGTIKVTYSILSMPSHIPRIFTDPVIRSNMMSTIKSYIDILESKN